MNFLLWALLVFGLTYLISASAILAIPRRFLKSLSKFFQGVLSCAPCTSFWVGLTLGLPGAESVIPWAHRLLVGNYFWQGFLDHFYGAVVAVGIVSLVQFLASVSIAEEED